LKTETKAIFFKNSNQYEDWEGVSEPYEYSPYGGEVQTGKLYMKSYSSGLFWCEPNGHEVELTNQTPEPLEGTMRYDFLSENMLVWDGREWVVFAGPGFNKEQDEKLAKLEDENGLLRKFGKEMLERHYTPNEEGGDE